MVMPELIPCRTFWLPYLGEDSDPHQALSYDRQTFDITIIGQCVVSDRNLECAVLFKH